MAKSRLIKAVGKRASAVRGAVGTTRFRLAVELLSLAAGVLGRNRRGPGARILGLRRVDARTGGPVPIRAVLIRAAVTRLRKVVMNRAFSPLESRAKTRNDARMSTLSPEMKEVRRKYRGDREALSEEMMKLYREHSVRPYSSCARVLPRLAATLAIDALGLWSTRGQGLTDRLAGTVVVVES